MRTGTPRRHRAWRPVRMPGVELSGELKDSAFAEPHFLVARDGKYIQLSELLYRITELADGKRTLGEIAKRVTASTDWELPAAQVGELIEKRLEPLGIIAPRTGSRSEEPSAVRPPAPPSPATLKLRAKVLGPRIIEPITSVLQALYWPPALVLILISIAATHAWLYMAGGLAESLVALIYAPALMSLVVPIVLLAGAFHEFGHAAALRYGGGHVRGMGVGLYLIYPVLYTDVTDSYRLGRWARLRTGLGGVYFHLVFALAVIVAFAVTRSPVLAAVVLLVNLEAVRQLLPLLRLDGYWILADLTGIPDPLTHLMAWVRSRTARLTGNATAVPALRGWVRRVFAIYAVGAAVVMVGLLVLLVTRLPWLIGNILDSLAVQMEVVSAAWQATDILGLLSAVVGVLFLVLPLVGLGYFAWTIGRLAVPPLWRATGRSIVLRAGLMSIAIALSVAGIVIWLAPSLSLRGSIEGLESHAVTSREHVQGTVAYAQSPPVGGDHAPIWQNCGFYSSPIRDERAVHSLEHGAVWITYDPGLAPAEIEALFAIAQDNRYVLVSPYEGLSTPVVATAWSLQLALDSATDKRLDDFVSEFAGGAQAPERNAPCDGGHGTPESAP